MPQEEHLLSAREQEDKWLDETLSQSFPASDPLPLRHKELSSADDAEKTTNS